MHILDDLFLAPSRDKCHRDLDNFIKLCNEVGVPITDEKTVGPATCLQFARINLDTINMQPRLPEDKLARCCGLLTEFYNKHSVTLKEKSFWVGELTIRPLSGGIPLSSFSVSFLKSQNEVQAAKNLSTRIINITQPGVLFPRIDRTLLSCWVFTTLVLDESIQFWSTFLPSWLRGSSEEPLLFVT